MNELDDVVLDDHRAPPMLPAAARVLTGDAQKGHLQQFQARLSERLRQADTAPRLARLGLLIGERRWLVDLAEAGEIVPMPGSITPVPLAAPWFRGLVNLRGALFGVSDLHRFLGEPQTPVSRESRLLAFGAALNLNAAILVSRMLGLHDPAGWQHMPSAEGAPARPWVGRALADPDGRVWHELSLVRLAADEQFLSASR